MPKTETPLTRGATIYELTAEERACMKRLTDAGLVVGIGEHAAVKRDRAELIESLEQAQALRPAMLRRFGYVPECVLDYCNKARALLTQLKESS